MRAANPTVVTVELGLTLRDSFTARRAPIRHNHFS